MENNAIVEVDRHQLLQECPDDNFNVPTDITPTSSKEYAVCNKDAVETKICQTKNGRTMSDGNFFTKATRPVPNVILLPKRRSITEKVEGKQQACEASLEDLVNKKRKGRNPSRFYEVRQCRGRGLGETPIHNLPNELLDHIFSYLSIQQRLRTELVCRRWRQVGKFVTWSKPRCLVFHPDIRKDNPFKGKCELNDAKLKSILSRCGPSIRHLTIMKLNRPKCNPKYKVVVTEESLKTIASRCPNLETIKLKYLKLNPSLLECLARGCSKLKSVTFLKFGTCDKGFSLFYQTCQALESLTLMPLNTNVLDCPLYKDAVQGEGFNLFNPNLLDLNLKGCSIDSLSLSKLASRCCCLRELRLTLSYPETVNCDLLLEMFRHFKSTLKVLDMALPFKPFNWCEALNILDNLEELHLYSLGIVLDCPCYKKKNCFNKVSPNLKILYVSNTTPLNHNNEEFILTRLFMNCDTFEKLFLTRSNMPPVTLRLLSKYSDILRVLDLRRFRSVNCSWCEFFGVFRSLEALKLTMCQEVTDQLANVLSRTCLNLKILHVSSTAITNEGLMHLASLPNLIVLDASDCKGITDEGVEVLAAHGKLEELYIANSSKKDTMAISDDGCCSLALFCPHFRILDVSNVNGNPAITDRMVAAFHEAVRDGFLKPGVELLVGGTAITTCVETCEGLEVYFIFYQSFNSGFKDPLDDYLQSLIDNRANH